MSAIRNAPACGAAAAKALLARRDEAAQLAVAEEAANNALQRVVEEQKEQWFASLLAEVREQIVAPFNATVGSETLRLLVSELSSVPSFVLATRSQNHSLAVYLNAATGDPFPCLRVHDSVSGLLYFPRFINIRDELMLLLHGKELTAPAAARVLTDAFLQRMPASELP